MATRGSVVDVGSMEDGETVFVGDRAEVIKTATHLQPMREPPPVEQPPLSLPRKIEAQPHVWKRSSTAFHPSWRFILVCLIVFFGVATLPLLGALIMLNEENYRFWVGRFWPVFQSCLVCGIGLVLLVTILALQRWAPKYLETQSAMVSLASIFFALLGICLIMISLPQSKQLYEVSHRIGHGCMNSLAESNLLMDYDTVLYTIKSQPSCMGKESVEDCAGWAPNKYTLYIQYLENAFQCGPVCAEMVVPSYMPPAGQPAALLVTNTTLLAKGRPGAAPHGVSALQIARDEPSLPTEVQVREQKLFTEGQTRTSCLTLVSTRLQVLAWCFCDLMFWEGIALLLVSFGISATFFMDQCLFYKS